MWRAMIMAASVAVASAHADVTTATGDGASYEEALANARKLAVQQAAGTMVIGSARLTNGIYEDRTAEFMSGVLTDYKVLDSLQVGGQHRVTILANVAERSDARLTLAASAEVPPVLNERVRDEALRSRQLEAIRGALDVPQTAYRVEVREVRYAYRGSDVEALVQVEIGWQPKWIADMRALVDLLPPIKPVAPQAEDATWGWIALSAVVNPVLPVIFATAYGASADDLPSDEAMHVLCLGSHVHGNADRCADLLGELPTIMGRKTLQISGRLVGTEEDLPLDENVVPVAGRLFRLAGGYGRGDVCVSGQCEQEKGGATVFAEERISAALKFRIPVSVVNQAVRFEFRVH